MRARFLVGSLGEMASPAWWRSQATSAAGARLLERHLFPRTALAASLETTGRAAAREHDARIGATGVYHLFRLPVADEVALREWLRQPEAGRVLAEVAALALEQHLRSLRKLAEGEAAPPGRGPINCGAVAMIRRPPMLRRLCAAYGSGFADGRPTFPYVVEEASG
ncbi:MAG: BrxE family protein [Chloroflexota bacterium]|nr:BrxE family protein [Chloroflexota bacterium]